ncbi:B12-binding domain-containing radical SAM protein [Ekhidna sp. To15]|uniref:B12-binding domain-containing radical SAM protein n=1 Tax=Ekhidna sp. To15 TaxID=3395267 RepID=UPI003F525178
MKVYLTHGYFISDDPKEQQIMKPYPPLGLLYISAFLSENNVENKVFDSTFSSFKDLKEDLKEVRPHVLAIYANLMTKVNVIRIMKFAKEFLPETKIVLGGPDVTYNISNYLKYGADYIVIGEGEESMLGLVQCLEKKGDVNDVDGVAFLDELGVEVKTKPRIKIREIDSLPFPNRESIDIKKYLSVWKEFHGESALNVSTQRGCPYTCKWCSTAVYGQSYRRRSPEKVVEELTLLQERYKPDTFWFVDDVFTVSHKWLDAFVEELQSKSLEIKFECISRADRMNKDVIAKLKQAGCFRVWIGAESGSQKIIDKMDRRVKVEDVREMIIATRDAGIEAGTFIMLGYPGETQEDIEETLHHLKVSNPDYYTITLAYPIKGTDLYTEIENDIVSQPPWAASTDRDIRFKRSYSDSYYKQANRYVMSSVAFHKLKVNANALNWLGLKLFLKSTLSKFMMWFLLRYQEK